MRLRHHPKICGSTLRPTRCVLGHRVCAKKQEHDNGEPNGQSQKNYRSEGSLMDNRSHSVCQFRPGVQSRLFAVIIHSKKESFQPAVVTRARVAGDSDSEFTSQIAGRLSLHFLNSSRLCFAVSDSSCQLSQRRRIDGVFPLLKVYYCVPGKLRTGERAAC